MIDIRIYECSKKHHIDFDHQIQLIVEPKKEPPKEDQIPLDALYHMDTIPATVIDTFDDLHIIDSADDHPRNVTNGMQSMISLLRDTNLSTDFIDDEDDGYDS